MLKDVKSTMLLLSEPVRLRVLHLLFFRERLWSVGEMATVLDLPQPTLSRHLATLRAANVLVAVADGQKRLYQMNENQPPLLAQLLAALEPSVSKSPECAEDLRNADKLTETLTEATTDAIKSLHKETDEEDIVFKALSHPTRRKILDSVARSPGINLNELAQQLQISRQAARQHLVILERGKLIVPRRKGRSRLHYYNDVPLHTLYRRWTDTFSERVSTYMTEMKTTLENSG